MRYALVALDYPLVDAHHRNVLSKLVRVGLVGELVQEERVHVVVPLPVRVGELTARQQRGQHDVHVSTQTVPDRLQDLEDALENLVWSAVGVVGAHQQHDGLHFYVEVEFAVFQSPQHVLHPESVDMS